MSAAIHELRGALPPMPAVARILARFDREKLGSAIEVMIALLDASEPDLDAEMGSWPEAHDARPFDAGLSEDSEPIGDELEPTGDERDAAYTEWTSRGRRKLAGDGHEPRPREEDEEEDDPAEEDDHGENGHDDEIQPLDEWLLHPSFSGILPSRELPPGK
jgi:hypothetical protein